MSDNTSNSSKNELPPISPEALESFQDNRDIIIKETVSRSLKRDHEVEHHGENAPQLLTTGLEFTTKMLEAAMSMGEVALLEDELKWAQDRLPHDGVQMEHVLIRFKIYRDVVTETLPSGYAKEITTFIDWMINYQQALMGQD
jgi:hypothetical protein